MDALQYARYKQSISGLFITKLIDPSDEQTLKKISSTSSHIDCLPSPSPSPEMHRRKAVSGKQRDLKLCISVTRLSVLSPLMTFFSAEALVPSSSRKHYSVVRV